MVIYLTKQTRERYGLKYVSELTSVLNEAAKAVLLKERGNRLLEWGAKLFYFDRRKCIQVMNLASNFTLILADIKKTQMQDLGNYMANYIMLMYKEDKPMIKALEKMFSQSQLCVFDKLSDKKAISTLNYTQSTFLEDGYRLYEYLEDGILHTLEVNREVNYDWLLTRRKIEETGFFVSGKLFRKLVMEQYGS